MSRRERRREGRRPVTGVSGRLRSLRDVRLLDVSPGGIGFETYEELSAGPRRLEIRRRSRTLVLEVEVCWSALSRTLRSDRGDLVPVYRAGARFLGEGGGAELWRELGSEGGPSA